MEVAQNIENGTSNHSNHNSSHKHKHKHKHKSDKKSSHHSKHKKRDKDRDRHRESSSKSNGDSGSPRKSEAVAAAVEVAAEVKIERRSLSPVKKMEVDDSEDDRPLSSRIQVKKNYDSDSEDDKPLIHRKPPPPTTSQKRKSNHSSDDSDSDSKPLRKKSKKQVKKPTSQSPSPKKKKPKKEEEEVWKWWEEEPRDDGVKWNFLEHKGPVFAAKYEKLPKSVHFKYDGKVVKLSEDAEEVAGFYSRFIEHEYTTKEKFNENFFKDWRRTMTADEKKTITDLRKCDFREINEYFKLKSEERKSMSKEEKLCQKEENERIAEEFGICVLDGHKEKIGNFRIEPPGLFRGRGDHPKMGMLKKRIFPEDVIINCSKDAVVPKPPESHRWKEVRHDNTVTWLACWIENVQGQTKYVMLNPTSRLKGEKDWLKYEKARELAKHIHKIRENYKNDFKSKEMRVRQRAVALYFIDKLALRAGNEKDEDQADTVGCCSLRVEHIELFDEKDGQESVVTFDFLGKDSIRYFNQVTVEKRVFKNLKLFMESKKPGDDLFDRLNTQILNKHLNDLLSGLTAKVFRTYNASHTLQEQLDELTPVNGSVNEKVLAYNRANRAVAVLCNHQRAVPKSHEKSMENLVTKIQQKKDDVKKVKKELKGLSRGSKDHEKKSAQLRRTEEQLKKLEMTKTDKDEGKEIALGTSKLNYLDPRISIAWCKKHDVPIEKVYNKTLRAKFRWAIDMADKKYRFD
ncbi:DNA topoisomerase I, mitochondrial [Folsomia candida]|uniref:DNA topoisomerase I n=1 Tax=Folsomia candida TaxID=158441 RepID=A0A226F2B2_FOLCA|nr:DNA topoisomerase I, mitochondrial [Folsomia candida]OXA63577.1 DNA topoisomerase 1 [Folsomia candida]